MAGQTFVESTVKARLDGSLVLLLSITAGIAVANLYYIQPLLGDIARSLRATRVEVGFAATLTQAGYAIGMLFILPLADIREKSIVREASLHGAMMFAAFGAFWTTLVFLLQSPPYHMGGLSTEVAGLFGLVGVVGATAAPIVGRIADRRNPRFTIWIGMGAVVLAYTGFLIFGFSLWGLIAGVILLDLGIQTCQISNQARILALVDEARNRLNTVYMVTYFIGGALGSLLASFGFSVYAGRVSAPSAS